MERPKKGWKCREHSFSKMIVWFTDGNTRTFYSLDWKNKYAASRDPELGLRRLEKLAAQYRKQAKAMIIYNLETGKPIKRCL